MAINIHDQYPSNTASPTPEYPFGAFRDRSSPTSDDGTTLQQDWSNDFFVLQWRLLKEAGIVPNGEVDTVLESQYFEALLEVIRQNTQELTLSDKYDGDDKSKVGTEFAVGEVYRRTVKRTGDTMTGSLNMRNNSIPANNTGAIVELSNVAGTGTFTTRPESGNAQRLVHKLPSRSGTLGLGNTASGATNGWIRDEVTGIITQWGYVSSTNKTVNFNIPFVQSAFCIMVSNANSQGEKVDNAFAYIKDKDSFFIATKGSSLGNISAFPCYWLAIGK